MTYFLVSVFLLLITPGPGVLSTAGVGAAFGRDAGLRYITGLFIGTNLVALAVVTGLATIILSVPWLRTVLLFLSAGYLFWLALKVALSGSKVGFIEASRSPGIIDGVLLQAINPKAYVVNTALFSGYAFDNQSFLFETLTKFVVINAIWIPIHLLWLAAGITLKRLALTPSTQRFINIVMALAMVAVVILALYSTYQGRTQPI
jgi:threonine/homoserine/homoserine lactone efflux protein